jgi:hypothetical protein
VTSKLCSKEGCTNQVRNGGVCQRHGAEVKVYRCSKEWCPNQVVRGGLCWTHGEQPKCSASECTNYAVNRGVCIKHGARDGHGIVMRMMTKTIS